MKKKLIASALAVVLVFSLSITGCANQPGTPGGTSGAKTKVGMATDAGTIDDKSFNQGTWEGIKRYASEKGTIEEQYLQPQGQQETDYINAIDSLIAAGNKLVITPGFKFATAINKVAPNNKDTSFILIDAEPADDKGNPQKHDNVLSIYFAEQQAGFLAGVAAALSTKTNKLGFIGGMEIPAVQKFGWGFKAGVKYANDKFGTKADVVQYQYQGSFDNVAAGQTIASGYYSQGVDIIFHAAGGVGVGVINEAIQRVTKGENVWVIGVDVDQYESGMLADKSKSVILTSAMKGVDVAAYDYIDKYLSGNFPGGQTITLTFKENGVGIPKENPNLPADVVEKVNQAKQDVLDGKFTVPSTQEELNDYLK